jgi:hypothetical protein
MLRSIDDVLVQLEAFTKWAPLRLYNHTELVDLIAAAKNCPIDALFRLLEVGAKMIEQGNFPDSRSSEFVDRIICDLHRQKVFIPCFGSDQQAARDELKRLHSLFSQNISEHNDSAIWNTSNVERVVRQQERRAAAGLPLMTDTEVDAFLGPSRRINVTERRLSKEDKVVESPKERFRAMDEHHRQEISFLAGLLSSWDDAYEGSKKVWEKMKTDPDFDIDVLISQIQFAFADFLVDAIRQFMHDEGFV